MFSFSGTIVDDNHVIYENAAIILDHTPIKEDYREIIATINGDDFIIEDHSIEKNDEPNYNRKELDINISKSIAPEHVHTQELNYRPIIGILAQEMHPDLVPWFNDNYTSYIGAAYVKYIEQAGARVVPVLINQSLEYYEIIFSSTNGLLLPGGAVSIDDSGKKTVLSNNFFIHIYVKLTF